MPRPRPEAVALGEQYHLGLQLPPTSGAVGQARGRGAGASVEFLDHRPYILGDDIRHLDWRAFARTDQLLVKRYQEEIRPTLEILVDGSASMQLDPDKAALTVDLTALLASAARADGMRVRITLLSDQPEPISVDRLLGEGLTFASRLPLQDAARQAVPRLQPGCLCVLLSDFLSPHEPSQLVRPLGARVGGFALLQVLSGDDIAPAVGGAARLEDIETGQTIDLVLDRPTVAAYLKRLSRLSDGLREASVRGGGGFARLRSDESLADQCRSQLVGAGVLRID